LFTTQLGGQVWVHVLSFVDAETVVASVGLVSHAFHALASEPQLWRRFFLCHHFPPALRSATITITAGGEEEEEGANLYQGEADGWRKSFFAHRWLAHSVRTHTHTLTHRTSTCALMVVSCRI
jgi:hypothetical protein